MCSSDLGEGKDRREVVVRLAWTAAGDVSGTVLEHLTGAPAALVRHWLASGNVETRATLVRHLGADALSGLALDWQGAEGLSDPPDAPLTVSYRVSGRAPQALDLGLMPEALGQAFAGLAERQSPLLFSSALDVTVDLELTSETPLVARSWPEEQVQHPLVRYLRTATVAGTVLRAHRGLHTRPAIVSPADYGVLARALRAVDAADALRVER